MVVLQVIIFSVTPPGLLKALLLKGEPSHRTTSQLSYSGGRVQYKFVVSKLHCKINFMSTFVSEGNKLSGSDFENKRVIFTHKCFH